MNAAQIKNEKLHNERDISISFFPKSNSYLVDASGFHYEVSESGFDFITPKEVANIYNILSSDLLEFPAYVEDFIKNELS